MADMRVRAYLVGLSVLVAACGDGTEQGPVTSETIGTTAPVITLPPGEVFSASFTAGLAAVSEKNGYPLNPDQEAALIDLWLEPAVEEGPKLCQSLAVGVSPLEYAAEKVSNAISTASAGEIRSAAVAVEALITSIVADGSLCPEHSGVVGADLGPIQAMVTRVMAEPGLATLPTEVVMAPVTLGAMTVFVEAMKAALLSGGFSEKKASDAVTGDPGEALLVQAVRLCSALGAGDDLTPWVTNQVESVELKARTSKAVEVKAVFDATTLPGSICPDQAENGAAALMTVDELIAAYR